MTDQNNAAQPVSEETRTAMAQAVSDFMDLFSDDGVFRIDPYDSRNVDAMLDAVLSKLRAPVAGEAKRPHNRRASLPPLPAELLNSYPMFSPQSIKAELLRIQREAYDMGRAGAPAAPQASEAIKQPACHVGHANFTPFYLLANLRRICTPALARRENWVLAIELFAVGGTTARRICREAGIDPDGKTVTRAALSAQPAKEPANPKPSAAGNAGAAGVSSDPLTGKNNDGGAVYG